MLEKTATKRLCERIMDVGWGQPPKWVWRIFRANDLSWVSALKGSCCQPRAMPWERGKGRFIRLEAIGMTLLIGPKNATAARSQGMALG